LKWKNVRLTLNVGTDDPDIANLELYRPKSSTLNMGGAQIPGKYYFMPSDNPNYSENYDNIFGQEPKVEAAPVVANPGPKKRQMSPENREKARLRMIAMHEKKRKEKEEGRLSFQEAKERQKVQESKEGE
jgi:hypothetical protein